MESMRNRKKIEIEKRLIDLEKREEALKNEKRKVDLDAQMAGRRYAS